MKKKGIIKMVETRINTEFDKYHNTPVDFAKSAAIKIVETLLGVNENDELDFSRNIVVPTGDYLKDENGEIIIEVIEPLNENEDKELQLKVLGELQKKEDEDEELQLNILSDLQKEDEEEAMSVKEAEEYLKKNNVDIDKYVKKGLKEINKSK